MNALLLTALTGSGQPDPGALLNKKSGTSAFADLLEQQTDLLDPELLLALPSLDLDPAAKNQLLMQLKQAGVNPELIQKLASDLQGASGMAAPLLKETVIAADMTSPTAASKQTDSATALAFIHSTLHIARESQALRKNEGLVAPQPKELATLIPSTVNQPAASAHPAANALKPQTSSTLAPATDKAESDFRANPALNNAKTAFLSTEHNTELSTKPVVSSMQALDKSGAQPALSAFTNTELSPLAPQTQNLTTTNPTFSPVFSAQITTPLQHSAQWSQDFSRVMVQMTQQSAQSPGLQTAEIRVDPPELGPLRIVLSVNDSVANAMIFAAHAQTRLTVEQALPQLQQQLNQAGLTLGEASVSEQDFSAHSQQQPEGKANSQTAFSLNGTEQSNDNSGLLPSDTANNPVNPNAIIDTFA